MFNVDREKERSIAHKKFNITNQTSIHHLQIFSIKKDSLQCTDIDLMMYRNSTSHVPKSYYKKTHVPKLISYVPKSSCTETVHPFVPKLCYRAFSLPGQFAPRSESANRTLADSIPGQLTPWPFRSLAISLPGTFASWSFRSGRSKITIYCEKNHTKKSK